MLLFKYFKHTETNYDHTYTKQLDWVDLNILLYFFQIFFSRYNHTLQITLKYLLNPIPSLPLSIHYPDSNVCHSSPKKFYICVHK